jgi:hypothetical protein
VALALEQGRGTTIQPRVKALLYNGQVESFALSNLIRLVKVQYKVIRPDDAKEGADGQSNTEGGNTNMRARGCTVCGGEE